MRNEMLLSSRFKNDGKPNSNMRLNPLQLNSIDIFRHDVNAGLYEFEKYDCECGAKYDELITIAEKDRYGLEVQTKICPKCGLLMTNPRMTQESYDAFYDKIYRDIYVGAEIVTEAYFEAQKFRGKHIYEFLKNNCDTGRIKNMLEIGCSAGGILAGLVSCGMTNNCKGIDLDGKYLKFGREKGLDLEHCHSEKLFTRKERYDLIILSRVIEHFLDLKKELTIIRQLLSDDGLLYIEVPGIKNVYLAAAYWGDFLRYFQNAHVRHFCRGTLSQVMRWNGFEEIVANEVVQSLYKKSVSQKVQKECINYFHDVMSHLQETEKKYSEIRTYLDEEKNEKSMSGMLTHVTFPVIRNLGDTVLSYCVRRNFDTLSKNSEKYSWFLLHMHTPVSDDILKKMNNTKGIVIGGGGVFLPDTNENSITGWQWVCPKNMLAKITSPIILYSVGYNYFRGQKPSELFIDNLNAIVKKASFVGLRNTGSIRKIQSLLENDLKNKVVYQPCTTTIVRKLIPNLPKKLPTKKVAINVAFDREDRRFGKDKELILTQVAQALKNIQSMGYEIYCIQHCDKDADLCKYLNDENVFYKNIDGVSWLPRDCFNFYNEMDIVLGARGHSQMIPFGMNTKIISLSSHDKMRWFLEDIDSLDWLIELTEDPKNLSDKIVNKFQEVQNDSTVFERLIEQQNKLYKITLQNNNIIEKIIGV